MTLPYSRTWIGKLTLTDFRNYRSATVAPGPCPRCAVRRKRGWGQDQLPGGHFAADRGPWPALLAVLRAGTQRRRGRMGGRGAWSYAGTEEIEIGTGVQASAWGGVLSARTPRVVKIDGAVAKGSGARSRGSGWFG